MITTAIEQRLNPNYIIDLSKPFHVSWWATALATEQDLIRAVNAAGVRAIEVFYYLRHEGARSTEGAHIAAHICGKKEKGSDDWRNGLPLCATHHQAYDAHLFAVKPNDALQVEFAPGVDATSIGVLVENLSTLRHQPHPVALAWRHERAARAWNRGPAP